MGADASPTSSWANAAMATAMARRASARGTSPNPTSPGTTLATKRYDPRPSNSTVVAAAASAHPGVGHLPGQSAQRNTSTASQSRGGKPTPTAISATPYHEQPTGGNRTTPHHTRRAGGARAASPATATAAAKTYPGRAGEDQSTQAHESTGTS